MDAPRHEPWVLRAARLYPERMAIDAPDGVLTYAELAAWAVAVAEHLKSAPGVAGEPVAIDAGSGAAFAAALHGVLIAGAVAVPVDGRLPAERRAAQLAAAHTTLTAERVTQLTQAGGAVSPPPAGATAEPAPLAGTGDDHQTPAVELTTSGTTGPGTPVLLSRGALLWNALGSAAALGHPAHERWLSALPVSHVGGISVIVRSAIAGTCAILRPRFDLDEQVSLLQRGEATIISVVPTMLGRLLDAGLDHPPALRLVLLGGAPISGELLARAAAAGITVAGTYGLSEACSQVLVDGHPLFCTDVVVRSDLPAGGAGDGEPDELLVRGPTIATGAAGPGGWLRTGDRARRAPDGSWSIIGRIAETIVTGGENVAPTEIEAVLCAEPEIADAAVLGVPDPAWGERVEARVVLGAGHTLDESSLRQRLRTHLPGFAVPKRITTVETLPRTVTGKLIRRELR